MGTIVERFAAGLGTTERRLATIRSIRRRFARRWSSSTGVSRLPAVDFANANYLLSFNANLFETFLSPVRYIYSYGQMRQGRPGHSRQVRAGRAAAVADGGVRRRVAADQAGHRRTARARDRPRHRQREAVRRGVRRPEHRRIRRMVGVARRLRAGKDRGADRCARRVDSARRARVCHAPAERRRRRQPRRRVADGDLRAERARRRIRPRRAEFCSGPTKRADPPAAGCAASGVGHQAWRPKPQPDTRHSRADRRDGRKPGQGAARARHQSALHAARSREAALGARATCRSSRASRRSSTKRL